MRHRHKAGERFDEPGAAHELEWTGVLWAPVCPTDDVPMVARNPGGWLCCGVCGKRADQNVRADR